MTNPSFEIPKKIALTARTKTIKQVKREVVDSSDSLQNQIDEPNQTLAQNTSQDILQDVPQDVPQEATSDVPQDTVQNIPQDPISEPTPLKAAESSATGGTASVGSGVVGGTVGAGESTTFALSNVVGVVGGVNITAGGLLAAGGGVVALAALGGGGGSTPAPASTAIANMYSYAGTVSDTNIVEGVNGGIDTIFTTAAADLSTLTVNGAADLEGAGADEGIEQIVIATDTAATFNGAQLSGNTIAVNESAVGTTNLIINVAAGATTTFANLTFGAFAGGNAWDDGADTITINGAGGAENITGTSFADLITGDAGNDIITGAGGADTLNGGLNDDTFIFATKENLNAAIVIDGGAGNDRIQMTAAATLIDSDFATGGIKAISIETLGLTGASTVTLGINANTAGIVNVVTGTGATNLTSTDIAILNVNAAALAQNTLLTLAGTTAKVVTGLVGDLQASGLTGVTTGDAIDNGISITTGSAATSITANGASDVISTDATALADDTTLTLIGSAAETVTSLIGDVVASNLTGALNITTGTVAGLSIATGSGANTINAGALTNAQLLILTGSTATVTGLVGDVVASNLTGALSVTTGDNTIDNTVSITTGAAATFITANGTGDVISTNAAALADNITLTLAGSAAATVTGLIGDVVASNLTGALNITTGTVAGLSIATGSGSNTINAGALTNAQLLTLTGSTVATVTLPNGDLAANTYTGNLTVTATSTAGSHVITTGSGNDTINGGTGTDIITGGAGNDIITGGGGTDSFNGGLNDDTFIFASKEDLNAAVKVDGGAGNDRIQLTAAIAGQLIDTDFRDPVTGGTKAIRIETLVLTGENTITLGVYANMAGIVNVVTGAGATNLTSTDIASLNVNAILLGDNVTLTMSGSSAATVSLSSGDLAAGTYTGDITVTAAAGTNAITTGSGNDTITGGAGVDAINGGTGFNTIIVSPGSKDTITGFDLASDTLRIVATGVTTFAHGTIYSTVTGQDGQISLDGNATFTGGNDVAVTFAAQVGVLDKTNLDARLEYNLTGSAGDDIITGGLRNDLLSGGLGDDTLSGGLGDDILAGDAGDNTLTGGEGSDTFVFNTVVSPLGILSKDTILDFHAGFEPDFDPNTMDIDSILLRATEVSNFSVPINVRAVGGKYKADQIASFLTGVKQDPFDPVSNRVFDWTDVDAQAATIVDLTGTTGNDILGGGANADTLKGGSGNDILTGGGGGTDVLTGGAGADTFVFNSVVSDGSGLGGSSDSNGGASTDIITDFESGTDFVLLRATNVNNFSVATHVTVDTALSNYVANLDPLDTGDVIFFLGTASLTNEQARATTVVDLTGTIGSDILSGGINADTLAGGLDADILEGGEGADTFVFNAVVTGTLITGSSDSNGGVMDTINDFVAGTDTVLLRATNVSNFNVATDVSGAGGIYTANLDKDAANLGDVMFLSTAFNTSADARAATVVDLTGRIDGNDILVGGANNDTLNGNLGSDTLTGGLGADQFVFNSALSVNNIDIITDFTVGIDHIILGDTFGAIAALGIPGVTINANNFFSGTNILDTSGATGLDINGISLGADDFIKYETNTGKLFYDADGNGAGAMAQFATLNTLPADLTAASFIFI